MLLYIESVLQETIANPEDSQSRGAQEVTMRKIP